MFYIAEYLGQCQRSYNKLKVGKNRPYIKSRMKIYEKAMDYILSITDGFSTVGLGRMSGKKLSRIIMHDLDEKSKREIKLARGALHTARITRNKFGL